MRHHRRVARPRGHLDRVKRLAEAADLVDLDEHAVGNALGNPAPQSLDVGHEQVIADQLNPVARQLAQARPAVPIVFGHAVLDRADRVAIAQAGDVGRELVRIKPSALARQCVDAVGEELRRRDVKRQCHIDTGLETRDGDRLDEQAQGCFVRIQVGSKAALVTHCSRQAPSAQNPAQRVIRLGAPAQRLAEGSGADGHDHELLQVDVVVGVLAAVDDVHHRRRQHMSVRPADVPIQRHSSRRRSGVRSSEGHRQHGVRAEPALVHGCI